MTVRKIANAYNVDFLGRRSAFGDARTAPVILTKCEHVDPWAVNCIRMNGQSRFQVLATAIHHPKNGVTAIPTRTGVRLHEEQGPAPPCENVGTEAVHSNYHGTITSNLVFLTFASRASRVAVTKCVRKVVRLVARCQTHLLYPASTNAHCPFVQPPTTVIRELSQKS